MSSLEEKLSRLNSQYQDEVKKCNAKYNELVREYKTSHSSKNSNFWTKALVFVLAISCLNISFFSCIACDCFNGVEIWFEVLGVQTLIIAGIVLLFFVCEKLISKAQNNRIQNSVNALEHERKKELNRLQKEYDTDRQQIIAQYNQKRGIYLKQLRESNNTLKLKKQIFSDFEQIYERIDKSVHIKELSFNFFFTLTQDDIMITALQGQDRFHDVSYRYERMQMKRLENIELCEALAVVLSQEVDFMIKEHYKQAKTNVECVDTKVQIEFDEVNMNYKGLEAW